MPAFTPGDMVMLSTAALMKVATEYPDLFESMREDSCIGGRVRNCTDNEVTIDVSDDFPDGLTLVYDPADPHSCAAVVHEEMSPAQPATEAAPATAGMTEHVCPVHGQPQGQPFSVLRGMLGLPIMPGMGMPAPVVEPVPQRVQTSQWVVVQFIGLKQYTIAQDVHRGGPPQQQQQIDAEAWKHAYQEDVEEERRPSLRLTPAETNLYEAALNRIRKWIAEESTPNAPGARTAHVDGAEE